MMGHAEAPVCCRRASRRTKAAVEQVTGQRLDAMLYKRMAARKLAVFRQYAQLYPEYCWVFVGDNGQACPA